MGDKDTKVILVSVMINIREVRHICTTTWSMLKFIKPFGAERTFRQGSGWCKIEMFMYEKSKCGPKSAFTNPSWKEGVTN